MNEFEDKLVTTIRKKLHPSYLNSNKSELIIRCPYCMDSQKNPKSAHLYIKLKEPYPYYCQLCNASDSNISNEFFKDIKIYDEDLYLSLYKFQMKFKQELKYKLSSNLSAKKLILPKLSGIESELIKLNYINNRLGIDLSLEDCNKFKIIVNFKEFFLQNKLNIITDTEETISNLNKYCVGFLSTDSNYIIFRNISSEKLNFRYRNYSILDNENAVKFYIFNDSGINILNPSVNLVLTEGIFDILGVYHHFYKPINENTIFAAVNGKGYYHIILYLARLGFLNINLEIYSDADVPLKFYQTLKKYNEIIKYSKIKIHYNTLKKDFGVTKDEIKLKSSII